VNIYRKIIPLILKGIIVLFSFYLVYLTGLVFYRDVTAFRSCSVNNSDLSVQSCGKTSFGLGDLVIIVLFVVALTFCISMLYWFIMGLKGKHKHVR